MGTTAPEPPRHVLRGSARRTAAEDWLLEAAPDRQIAAAEWAQHGVALLTAGQAWDAVRAPYTLLNPESDRQTDPAELHRRWEELQVPGAVFCAYYRPHLYILVPPKTDRHWPHHDWPAEVEILGQGQTYIHRIGIPYPKRIQPPGPFWLVPPHSGHRLASPKRLHDALHARADQTDPPEVPR